mgnify:CR=1 FL=1
MTFRILVAIPLSLDTASFSSDAARTFLLRPTRDDDLINSVRGNGRSPYAVFFRSLIVYIGSAPVSIVSRVTKQRVTFSFEGS